MRLYLLLLGAGGCQDMCDLRMALTVLANLLPAQWTSWLGSRLHFGLLDIGQRLWTVIGGRELLLATVPL